MKKPVVSKPFTTFKSAIKFAANQDYWNDETYDFDIIVNDNSGKILAKKYFSAIGIYNEEEDSYDEFWEKVKSMKGVSNIEVTVGVAEYKRKKIATHNFKTIKEAEKFISDIAYEGRLDAYIHDIPIDLIMNIYDLSDMDIYAKGGMFGGGGGTDDFVHPNILYAKLGEAEMNFQKDNGAEYNRVRQELEDNAAKYYAALNNAEMNFQKDNGAEYNRLIAMRYLFAKGGKTSKKKTLSQRFNYIPNYMIQEVEVERKGKTTFIDAANILDGVYVKKGVKYADGGEISHLAPKSKTHRNNEK
jgi:hypothetical protein